jgi:hypothetical protein
VSFLLDTNVVSEWVKPRPDPGVVGWLEAVDEDRVFLSVITLAELRHGVDRMATGDRRQRIDEWLRDALPLRFEGRVLAIDEAVADAWGCVMAEREAIGRRLEPMDAFIAATAKVHDLAVVTRNTSDFEPSATVVLNPWQRT